MRPYLTIRCVLSFIEPLSIVAPYSSPDCGRMTSAVYNQ
jgi:hypothetical protein